MVVIEDLLLVFLFIIIISYYIKLKNNLKNQRRYFIDSLNHDLKVPALAQLRGLEVLQNQVNFDSKSLELLNDISTSCRFSLDMITMLVNTYKYEDKESALNTESLNLSEIILLCTNEVAEITYQKGIRFCYSIDANTDIFADKDALHKVIYNLICTSVYNANNNSTIYFKVKKFKQKIYVSITYHGFNITDAEKKKHYFTKSKYSTVGHNIKLHLCKKIINMHHGKIFVKKYGEDTNSIVFSLPVEYKNTLPVLNILSFFQLYRL